MNPNRKRNPRHQARFNPLGFAEEDLEEKKQNQAEDDNDYEDEPQSVSILHKLQGFDPKARELATISIAQIGDFTPGLLQEIVDQGILKLLTQRLVDPSPQIVLNTLMALINIAESNGSVRGKNIGEIILDQGTLILLESILSNYKKAHENREIDIRDADFKTKLAIVDSCYRLLSTLAEVVGEKYLNNLLNSEVTTVSIYFMVNCDEPHILTGIASYLQVLTEVSVELCQQLGQNLEFIKRLGSITEQSFCTQELRAYILGALYNYVCTLEKGGFDAPGKIDISQKVMSGVMEIIGVDIFQEIQGLIKIFEANRQDVHPNENEQIELMEEHAGGVEELKEGELEEVPDHQPTEHEMKYKEALRIWNDSAIAIEICLGILINMFESDETADDWEEDNEENENVGKANDYTPANTTFMLNMTQDVKEKLLVMLANKCQHLPKEVQEALTLCNMGSVSEQAKKIIDFAYASILNIVLNIGHSQDGINHLDKIAEDIFKICWDEGKYYMEHIFDYANSEEKELESNDKAELKFYGNIIVEITKIIIYLLQTSTVNLAKNISVVDLLKAQAVIFDHLPQEAKSMMIGLVGIRCHPKNQITMEENAMVADFLNELLLHNNDLMILGEALNALFDVYSEETYDQIFINKGFMNTLTVGYDIFKNKIAEAKPNLSKENYALLRNHLLNLKRFIKYKQEHIPQ